MPIQKKEEVIRELGKHRPEYAAALSRTEPIISGAPVRTISRTLNWTGTFWSEAITTELIYDIPSGFDGDFIHQEMRHAFAKEIPSHLDALDVIKLRPDFNPLEVTDTDLSNSLEGVFVWEAGRIAHQANVPFFRYRIKVARGTQAHHKGFTDSFEG